MGQVGSAGDNAAMESFFALLQRNVLDRRRWATRDELRIAIVTWIERTYHRRRRQAALSPAEVTAPAYSLGTQWTWGGLHGCTRRGTGGNARACAEDTVARLTA
jgi:transposase InsO family protein